MSDTFLNKWIQSPDSFTTTTNVHPRTKDQQASSILGRSFNGAPTLAYAELLICIRKLNHLLFIRGREKDMSC